MSASELSRFGNPKSQYDPTTKIWSGPKEAMDTDLDKSIGELMLESLLKNPELISQICMNDGREYSNKEIAEYAISIACHFRELGFEQGEVVGFVGLSSEYSTPLVIGALLNGLAISALHPSLEKEFITDLYSITKPSIVFCDGSIHDRVKESLEKMGSKAKIYTMIDHIPGVPEISEFLKGPFSKESFEYVPLKNGGKQVAFITSSSGTTGLPKGVILTHESLKSRSVAYKYKRGDRVFCYTTLYWISGVHLCVAGTLSGATYIYSKLPFKAEDFFQVVEKYKPTMICAPPTMLALCLASPDFTKTDYSCLKCLVVTGAAVRPTLIDQIRPYFTNCQIIAGYGMTEVPGGCISGGLTCDVVTAGQLAVNIEMKVVDDDNKSLGPNETGEFYVRSNLAFPGYYGNPAATAAFTDEDGWMITGDVGYVNEDGNIFIEDRKKDIEKHFGFHYSPTELETVIMELDGVSEVCVCGIPDEIAASFPAAIVVREPGSCLSANEIYEHVANKVNDYKKLRGGVYFVNSIPKTPSGKTLRRKVVEMCTKFRNDDLAPRSFYSR